MEFSGSGWHRGEHTSHGSDEAHLRVAWAACRRIPFHRRTVWRICATGSPKVAGLSGLQFSGDGGGLCEIDSGAINLLYTLTHICPRIVDNYVLKRGEALSWLSRAASSGAGKRVREEAQKVAWSTAARGRIEEVGSRRSCVEFAPKASGQLEKGARLMATDGLFASGISEAHVTRAIIRSFLEQSM